MFISTYYLAWHLTKIFRCISESNPYKVIYIFQLLLGGSIGLLLTTILIAVIATVIIINLRDLREWKRYVEEREANQKLLMGTMQNPLFDEKGFD